MFTSLKPARDRSINFWFDAERGEIKNSAIPNGLQPLLDHLQQNSGSLRAALRAWRSDDEAVKPDVAGLQPAQKLRSTAITGWQFDEGIPAIVHPIFHHTHPTSFQASPPTRLDPVDWVVVVLNLNTVRERILPGLTQRYFAGSAGLEYKVAVVDAGKTPRSLYSSDPGFGVADVSSSDSVMNIFGPPPESTEGSFWQTVKNSRSVRGEQWRSFSGRSGSRSSKARVREVPGCWFCSIGLVRWKPRLPRSGAAI